MNTYPASSNFRELARVHMRSWAHVELGVDLADPTSVVLPRQFAAAGRNFYSEDVRRAVNARFPNTFVASARMGRRSLAGDALCSAHAPFNLFAPPFITTPAGARALSELLSRQIDHVNQVEFEMPGSWRRSPLGDNTSFDARILCQSAGVQLRLGVEVKFTEGPSAWTKAEHDEMHSPIGRYRERTQASAWIAPNVSDKLATPHMKQMWRNLLLAESLPRETAYVHLYPTGNAYQAAVSRDFAAYVVADGCFRPLTYEDYFDALARAGCDADWLGYLRRRYLVAAAPI